MPKGLMLWATAAGLGWSQAGRAAEASPPPTAVEALEPRRLMSATDDGFEDNDRRESPDLPVLEAGQAVDGVLLDNDYFRFEVGSGGLRFFEARVQPGVGHVAMQLMRPDGTLLADARPTGLTRTVQLDSLAEGEYLIYLYGQRGWEGERYTLAWEGQAADAPAPDRVQEAPSPDTVLAPAPPPAPAPEASPGLEPAPSWGLTPDAVADAANQHAGSALVWDLSGVAGSVLRDTLDGDNWYRLRREDAGALTVQLDRVDPGAKAYLEVYDLERVWLGGSYADQRTHRVTLDHADAEVLVLVRRYDGAATDASFTVTAGGGVLSSQGFEQAPVGLWDDAARARDFGAGYGKGPREKRLRVVEDWSGRGDRAGLRVAYPGGTYGAEANGANFLSRLNNHATVDSAYLSYRVIFNDRFDFERGGKLPGLVGGGDTAVGGVRADGRNGFSIRAMWGEQDEAYQYVYHMDQPRRYGDRMDWLGGDGEPFRFRRGVEYHIAFQVRLNSIGPGGARPDGSIRVFVDGEQVLARDRLRFRDVPWLKLDHLFVSTFHGGGNVSWAPDRDSYATFDDFLVLR